MDPQLEKINKQIEEIENNSDYKNLSTRSRTGISEDQRFKTYLVQLEILKKRKERLLIQLRPYNIEQKTEKIRPNILDKPKIYNRRTNRLIIKPGWIGPRDPPVYIPPTPIEPKEPKLVPRRRVIKKEPIKIDRLIKKPEIPESKSELNQVKNSEPILVQKDNIEFYDSEEYSESE